MPWAMQTTVGAHSMVIGRALISYGPGNIVRLADMATAYFWKYRARSKREGQILRKTPGEVFPPDTALNFSPARVRKDLGEEINALEWLQGIEYYLQSKGMLPMAAQLEETYKLDPKAGKPETKRRGVKEQIPEIRARLDELNAFLLQIHDEGKSHARISGENKIKLEILSEQIAEVDDRIARIEGAVNETRCMVDNVLNAVREIARILAGAPAESEAVS